MASQVLLASRQRRAMMASAPATVQCMPACLSLCPTIGLAAGLDDAGADEQAAGAEPVVAHAGRVVEEVAELPLGLVFLDAFEGVFADGGLDAVDVAVVEVFEAGGEPFVPAVAEHELQGAGEGVQVLAGVVEVDDLGGLGELVRGDAPDPGGAVAEDGELADVVRAAADPLGPHQAGERGGGLEGRDDAGGFPVPDRVAVLVELVLGEEDASLTSRVRARPSSPFPSLPAVSFAVIGTPVPSMTA